MERARIRRRLPLLGAAAIALSLVALVVPVHAGTSPCGSVVDPGAEAGSRDCKDYQRLLLLGAAPTFLVGVGLVVAGRHARPGAETTEVEDGLPEPADG